MSNDSIPSNVSHLPRDVSRDPLARPPLSLAAGAVRRPQPQPRFDQDRGNNKFVAKGHDRQLEDVQRSGQTVKLYLMAGGDSVTGVVIKRDKYTITLRQANGSEVFYYKHAIEGVEVKAPEEKAI